MVDSHLCRCWTDNSFGLDLNRGPTIGSTVPLCENILFLVTFCSSFKVESSPCHHHLGIPMKPDERKMDCKKFLLIYMVFKNWKLILTMRCFMKTTNFQSQKVEMKFILSTLSNRVTRKIFLVTNCFTSKMEKPNSAFETRFGFSWHEPNWSSSRNYNTMIA